MEWRVIHARTRELIDTVTADTYEEAQREAKKHENEETAVVVIYPRESTGMKKTLELSQSELIAVVKYWMKNKQSTNPNIVEVTFATNKTDGTISATVSMDVHGPTENE